jgi:hypothetical protein
MVYPGTLFIGDNGAFLCIPMQIGVKFEHYAWHLVGIEAKIWILPATQRCVNISGRTIP